MSNSKFQLRMEKARKRFFNMEKIGGGGNGTVYRAYDKNTSQEVALKILHGTGEEREHRSTGAIFFFCQNSYHADNCIYGGSI